MNITKKTQKLKYIIFLFIIFSFTESKFVEVNLDEDDFSEIYNVQNKQFKIKGNSSPYVKITVEGKDDEINNHIISYYQDEDLKERKQLSQSIKDTTIMWLTQGQIKNVFYITVECAKDPCSFKINIDKKEKAELYLNEQYTYYITEENKEIDFFLKDSKLDYKESLKYYVHVWVKGNYEIESQLSGGDKESHSSTTYNYYRVEYDDDFIDSNFKLNIKGKVGDLINVGLIFFRECVDNHCGAQLKLENGEEVSGYLPYRLGHIYPFNSLDSDLFPIGNVYDVNNKHINGAFVPDSNYYNIESGNDDVFYTLQHINETKYDGQGNNKYSPLLNGVYNYKYLYEGTTIGLIPMKPEEDFNYLTYEVIPFLGNIDVSIYECDTYPLCHINNEIIKKSKKIEEYKNYYHTYKKEEWGEDITPISKKQNMLLITCKNGINTADSKSICSLNTNMKTDKKFVNYTDFTIEKPPYCRFIRQDNEDKYFLQKSDNQIQLYIEKITGDISIEINGKKDNYQEYSQGNKYFFIIPKNKDSNIIIKANKNSFYSINGNYNNKKEIFTIGYNYLMSIDNNIQLSFYEDEEEEVGLYSKTDSENNREALKKEIRFLFKNVEDYNADDIVDSYMGFYPLNCDINVKITLGNHIKANQNIKKDNYYQEIFSDYYNYKIEITKIDNSEETCYFYISSFSKDNNNNYGITLLNNTLQEIIFTEDRNLIPFSFPHTNLENDININFEPLNKAEYIVKVKINDEIIEKKTINSKSSIILKADAIKKKCEDFKYICNILLDVEKNQKEANFKITLTSLKDYGKVIDDDDDGNKDSDKASDNGNNGNNDDDDDDDDDDKLIIILSIFGAVAITIIIGVIIYITQVYNKNKHLNETINQISFKDNDDDKDAIGESLLD